MEYELPDLVVGTGGTDAAAGSLLAIGVTSPRAPDFFPDCCYCLDAPDYVPAGGMRSEVGVRVQQYAKRA